MKLLSLKIWLPVLFSGILIYISMPTLYKSKAPPVLMPDMSEILKREGSRTAEEKLDKDFEATIPKPYPVPKTLPTPEPINWMGLLSQICIGLGSLASVIRGIIELVKLFIRKKEKE